MKSTAILDKRKMVSILHTPAESISHTDYIMYKKKYSESPVKKTKKKNNRSRRKRVEAKIVLNNKIPKEVRSLYYLDSRVHYVTDNYVSIKLYIFQHFCESIKNILVGKCQKKTLIKF